MATGTLHMMAMPTSEGEIPMKPLFSKTLMVLAAALVALSLGAPALAADSMSKDKAHHNIASTWMIWAKHGQSQAFEQGLKKHTAWRKSAGDPFTWHIYQPVVGDDLGYTMIRSGNHAWGDMDSETTWSMKTDAGEHYQQDVGVHAHYAKHYFGETATKYSHWIDSKDYRYFGVTVYHFKSGHGTDVRKVLKKVHDAVTGQNWPYPYSIEYTIGGHGGMAFVTPMKSYADMAEPSPSLMDVMTKAMGSKEAARKLFDTFSAAVKTRSYTIYVYRPDLSTPE